MSVFVAFWFLGRQARSSLLKLCHWITVQEAPTATRRIAPYRDAIDSRQDQLEAENRRLLEQVDLLTLESSLKDETIAELQSENRSFFSRIWLIGIPAAAFLTSFAFCSPSVEEPRREIPPPVPIFIVVIIHETALPPTSSCEACWMNHATRFCL